jgi:hypothetical protein
MAKKRKKTSFHHPICHFITGERLHYVLLKVKTKLFTAGEKIEKVISDSKLGISGSSCAYFIFGDSDVLVRIWATESHLEQFKEEVRKHVPEVEDLRVILIERISTWYQRRIENQQGWHESLDEKAVQAIADHNVPQTLRTDMELKSNRNGVKFFIFIEEPFAKRNYIFRKLQDDLISGQPEFLQGMDRISLYSYIATDGLGVLIKGEVGEAKQLTSTLLAFAERMKEYAIKTTTFVCAKTIKLDESALNSRLRQTGREKEIFYNLVRSHDCYHACIKDYGGEDAENRASRFEEIGAELNPQISLFRGEHWWVFISDLRLLYKWVAFGDTGKLLQKLGREYVKLDRRLNEVLDAAFQRYQEEKLRQKQIGLARTHRMNEQAIEKIIAALSSDLRMEKHCTLGAVPGCIEAFVKIVETKKDQREVLLEFSKTLRAAATDRDELMHGRIESEELLKAEENNKRRWVWERFVQNYLKTFLLLPKVLPMLEDLTEAFLKRNAPPANPQ